MKMHSFFRETVKMRARQQQTSQHDNDDDDDNDPNDANSRLMESFAAQASQYFLFFFVPTLIYRNSYPRRRKINWGFVLRCFAEVLACVFYTYTVFASFSCPEFQKTAREPGNWQSFVLSCFNSMLPSILVYLLTFFALLHAWLNAWAEITRFADRCFYESWWNSRTYSEYYRMWKYGFSVLCFSCALCCTRCGAHCLALLLRVSSLSWSMLCAS
jgi:sterol O-acyltransferase